MPRCRRVRGCGHRIGASTNVAPGIRAGQARGRGRPAPSCPPRSGARASVRAIAGRMCLTLELQVHPSVHVFIARAAARRRTCARGRGAPRRAAFGDPSRTSANAGWPADRAHGLCALRPSVAEHAPSSSGLRRPARNAAAGDECPDTIGIRRGEEEAEPHPLGPAEDRGTLGAGGVHDGPDVVHARLERGVARRRRRGRCRACRSGSRARTRRDARSRRASSAPPRPARRGCSTAAGRRRRRRARRRRPGRRC